ncbi:uridine kinase [Pseudarthrobacter sulfonivorans]|uniref:uridine kinase n=1 Tax=Pseudarthrobacter sulfonivorans TaxID=121292 RepID=UPI002866F0CF|nr:uridine kinase [Pseudarthrobacter sulfonivorans]MDR6415530.1 uridine kinase [Pseudarthrobacter sulfonivorans]
MSESRPTAARTVLLRSLAKEFLPEGMGRSLIAVDGVDGSGKSTFADDLAAVIGERPVIVIRVDDFLNLRDVRHQRGRESPEGFWLDTYDYETLFRDVLVPLGRGGNGCYRPAATDHRKDVRPGPPIRQAPEDAVVIVEGMFLHRDELAECWDYSCFLDVPFTETARRMAVRDGSHPDPEHQSMRRYVGGQRLYFEAAQPWQRATRVVDNTNPARPRILPAGEVHQRRH